MTSGQAQRLVQERGAASATATAPGSENAGTGLLWPASPLDAAERAFGLLTRPPAPLSFDCRTVPGLPQRILGLDELRNLLLTHGDSGPGAGPRSDTRAASRRRQVGDVVWRDLVTRARRDGPAWVVAAAGVALPGMRRRVRLLSGGWHGQAGDLESEMLLGFLERLRTIDLADVNICGRLISAGARAAERARAFEDDNDAARAAVARSVPPARPWDHPEFVLARAVHAGAITARDAAVIARTRLENDTLTGIAAELGVPAATVTSWRQRAEHRLAEAIRAGDLL